MLAQDVEDAIHIQRRKLMLGNTRIAICAAVGGLAIANVFAAHSIGQNETKLRQLSAKMAPRYAALTQCHNLQAMQLATPFCEPATSVVESAFERCGDQEKAYRNALMKHVDPTLMGIDDRVIAKIKADTREGLLMVVAGRRKAKGQCLENPN